MLTLMFVSLLMMGEQPVYGKAPSEATPLVTIEALMSNPEQFLGKVIKVQGKVQEVCPMKGCWMDLSAAGHKVRIKVQDGEIVFDKKLTGQEVLAEGTVYKFELSQEEAVSYYQHMAEERGEEFDPASVTTGATIYQIGGLGAQVVQAKKS